MVKVEALNSIQEFYELDSMEQSLNSTFVVLIPKKVGVSDVKDFRPISLIGRVYKIISKLLANRFKEVLGMVVMPHISLTHTKIYFLANGVFEDKGKLLKKI